MSLTKKISGIKLNNTVLIDKILDEDDFISNSDTAVATQQSIKFYADTASSLTSCGVVNTNPPTLTNNGNGTVNVSACTVNLRDNGNHTGYISEYEVSAITNLEIVDANINYICADYNSGTPIYTLLTAAALSTINESDIIPIFTLYRYGTNVNFINWDALGSGLTNKLHARVVKTTRFGKESGIELSEKNTRELLVSSGVVWHGAVRVELDAVDSLTDPLIHWHKVASVWTSQVVTQYNNSQYCDGTDLQTLLPNKYTVNWVYRTEQDAKIIAFVLGGSYDKLSDAQAATLPEVPPQMYNIGFRIGRILVKTGEDTAIIQSDFDKVYNIDASTFIQDHIQAADNTKIDVSSTTVGVATVTSPNTGTDLILEIINGSATPIFSVDASGFITAGTVSETQASIVEIATQTETNTGADDVKVITPLKLKVYVDNAIIKSIKTITTNYTITNDDYTILAKADANDINITLPDLLETIDGIIYVIKLTDIGTGYNLDINIVDTGVVFEDLSSTINLSTPNDIIKIQADYTNLTWVIIN